MIDRSIAPSNNRLAVSGAHDALIGTQKIPMLRSIFAACAAILLAISPSFAQSDLSYELVTLDDELSWPWCVAELTEGGFLITEREGRLVHLRSDGSKAVLDGTPATYFAGQGGYFDVVLGPNFERDRLIYLSYAAGDAQANGTAIFRATFEDGTLSNGETILQVARDKDTAHHYGGKLLFLPDDSLLITTGEGFEYREEAQSLESELGKVLRVSADGEPLGIMGKDGKTRIRIWTYGHRNPQGLAFDSETGTVFLHEHGPRGGDEVNVLVQGNNYGWPAVTEGVDYSGAYVSPFKRAPGMEEAIWSWVPSIAPSGMAWYNAAEFPEWQNSLFLGALVDEEVRRLEIADDGVVREETLFAELEQRIRDVRVFNDKIYIVTDGETGSLIRVDKR
ncbi:MAG: PQQ-dependent sugar dehydrogenase [Pseudomonadota bacterium]